MTRAKAKSEPLKEYPRPSVAVDVAVLTVTGDVLQVLVVEHRLGGSALPGTFLHAGETLAMAADRALCEKAQLTGVAFEQLHVFDDPDRDDRGWVLSVGHLAATAVENMPHAALLVPVVDGQVARQLLFDHDAIVSSAVASLREGYGRAVDPSHLLGDTFTVLALRLLYEAIFGHPLIKDTFRRHVINHLADTGQVGSEATGRPAALFRRKVDAPLPPSAAAFFARDGTDREATRDGPATMGR